MLKLIVGIALVLVFGVPCHAQRSKAGADALKSPVVVEKSKIITVDINGNAIVSDFGVVLISELSKFEELLGIEEVQAELELTADQSEKLEAHLAQARQDRLAFRDKSWHQLTPEATRQIGTEFAQLAFEFDSGLDAILLPHQQRLLEQIGERLLFRRIGWRKYFDDVKSKEPDFKPGATELRQVKAAARKLSQEITDDCKVLVLEDFKKLSTPLEEQQQKVVEPFIADLSRRDLNFDLMLAQLDERHVQSWSYRYQNVLDRPVVYFIQPDGKLLSQSATDRMRQSTGAEMLAPYFQLIDSLQTGEWNTRMQLDNQQMQELSLVQIELLEAELDMANRLAESENPTLEIERSRDRQVFLRKEARSRILGILRPEQSARLNDLYMETAVRRFGIFSDLIAGELGRAISITESQKSDLRKIAKQIQAELRSNASEMEDRYFDEILSCLNRDHETIIRKRIGKNLTHISANITQLVETKNGEGR